METETKKWIGKIPQNCDICNNSLTDYFVDGKTQFGSWANMCPTCHTKHGKGLGVGYGQKYNASTGDQMKS